MTRRLSLPACAILVAVTAAAVAATVLFNPSVDTVEIQRRDRLSPQAQFVDFTYWYLLGRPPDDAGLADYAGRVERDGPEAVAQAILTSREFLDKHPDGRLSGSPVFAGESNPATVAARYVQLYQAGDLRPAPTQDGLGKVGFVLLLALTTAGILFLQRYSTRKLGDTALHVYLPKGYVVALFAALGAIWFLNSQALFYAFAPGSLGYVEWLDRLTNLSILRGVSTVWTPYPQGTQMILVVLETIASTVSAPLQSDIWTSYTLFRWLFQAAFLFIPSCILVSVVYEIGMLMSPATATFAAVLVALSFAVMYYGVASTVVTDPLPAVLAVLAIWFVARERGAWAGLALGLGAALKLIPLVILVPLFVLAVSWKSRFKVAAVALITLACVFVPFALADSDVFLSPFRWQTGRPAWESWYGFVNWLAGVPHEYPSPAFEDLGFRHDFGWVFWGITPPLTSLVSPVPASAPRWDNLVSALGTVVSLAAVVTAKSRSPRAMVRWSMYALAVTFFWSIGWSPQYELYLVPLVALAFETPLVAAGAALGLQALTFLEYPLFLPWAYFYGGSAVWLAWGATLARYLVLGWLAVYVLRTEASPRALIARFRLLRVRSGIRRAVLAGTALALSLVPLIADAQSTAVVQSVDTCGPTRYMRAEPSGFLPEADWWVPGGWFFSQAGEWPNGGYSIWDDANAQMWSEFTRLGGWRALGFPASRRFMWHGMLSQATQRAVLQWSPVTGQVEFANVLDLMHDQGSDADLLRLKQIPPPLDVDEAGLPYETIAARRLAWLDARPAIRTKYCNAPGGADPVQLWGLPTSQAINVSDSGGEVYVLRTQRAAFQEWVGGADWAAPGEVTVVLAGDLAKAFKLLPPDAAIPEPAPPR